MLDRLRSFMMPVEARLRLTVGRLFGSQASIPPSLKAAARVGDTCLRNYYTARGYQAAIPDWCYKVEARVRSVLGIVQGGRTDEHVEEVLTRVEGDAVSLLGCGRCKLRDVPPCGGDDKMTDEAAWHPDERTALDYIRGLLSDQESLRVDSHLAECEECLELIRTLAHVRDHFDEIWDSWTPAEHGRAYRQWRLLRGLEGIVEQAPALSDRIAGWMSRLGDQAEVIVRVLIDRARLAASAAPESLPEGCAAEMGLAFAGVGSAQEQSELRVRSRRSSELLAVGRVEDALAELEAAAGIDARSVQSAEMYIHRDERQVARIEIDARWKRVSVTYWPSAGEQSPPLVVLLPSDPDSEARLGELSHVAGADWLVAEFSDVEEGEYTVVLSPAAPPDRQ
jgi:hypothetical protein